MIARNPLAPAAGLAVLVASFGTLLGCATQFVDVADYEPRAPELMLPLQEGSVKLAAIGDSGTGQGAQYRIGAMMAAVHQAFPFEFVVMMGDNLYGRESPGDYEEKFERPYAALLDAGVRFYATLGNHDDTNQSFYEPFGMDGRRYYTFRPKGGVRFFALDSNYMAPEQLEWLQGELAGSGSEWKIAFFHHPIYSSGGRHGSNVQLRQVLEPLFLQHGVDVVLQGHDHFYERLKPQGGIHYFVSGAAAKLRRGDIDPGVSHAEGFDQGYHFMLIEIADRELHFQVVSDTGETVDRGRVVSREAASDVMTAR